MENQSLYAHRDRSRDAVLLVGPDSKLRDALTRELHALHARTLQVDSLAQASVDPGRGSSAPTVLLIPEAMIEPERFEADSAELQISLGSPRLVPIAIGRTPDDERRRVLRDVGIELALFGRFGRHALRFQLNRARSPFLGRAPRGEQRAPMEWRTRTYSSGREKPVRCYSLSRHGGYFVTPRPWVVGTEIAIELPLLHREQPIRGRVLYTKSASDVFRRDLPGGMAVRFETLPARLEHAIERDLTAMRFGLEV